MRITIQIILHFSLLILFECFSKMGVRKLNFFLNYLKLTFVVQPMLKLLTSGWHYMLASTVVPMTCRAGPL